MASISTLKGVTDSSLVGQVTEKTRPAQEPSASASEPAFPAPPPMKEIREQEETAPNRRIKATLEETQEVAKKLQERIDEASQEPHMVSITTDHKSNTSVIQIKDPEGRVIKQFPPEKVLNLHQRMDDLSGMVIDEMI